MFTAQASRSRPRILLCLMLVLGLGTGTPASARDLELRVGIARDATLPLSAVDQGVLSGLAIDLARLLTEELGVQLALSLLPERDLVAALRGGRIDLILTSMPAEELQTLRLLPSLPLLQTGQLAIIGQDNLDRFPRPIDVFLTDAQVGYTRGTMAARIVHQRMPKARRVPFPAPLEAIRALNRGDIDVLVLDALQAWNLLGDPSETGLTALLEPLTSDTLVWAVRESEVHLLARINNAIGKWRDTGALARLIGRWIPVRIEAKDWPQ